MVLFKLTGQAWPYIDHCSHQPTGILAFMLMDLVCSWVTDCHLDPRITGYSGPNGSTLAASSMLASAGNISAISPISGVS